MGAIEFVTIEVADTGAAEAFYSAAFEVGSRVRCDGPIKLTLNKRGALAKTAGVSTDGSGSHWLVIGSDTGAFTDPDGFVWETPTD